MPTYLSPGVYVEEIPSAVQSIAGVGTSTAGFIGIAPNTVKVPKPNPEYDPTKPDGDANRPFTETNVDLSVAGEPVLCTTFSDYMRAFGGFSSDAGLQNLTHAVYGFFNNGGSRCYVVRVLADTAIGDALDKFEAIDE